MFADFNVIALFTFSLAAFFDNFKNSCLHIQASINKLKREATERGSREASVLSDAGDETESIGSNSDAFGDPFFQRERKR